MGLIFIFSNFLHTFCEYIYDNFTYIPSIIMVYFHKMSLSIFIQNSYNIYYGILQCSKLYTVCHGFKCVVELLFWWLLVYISFDFEPMPINLLRWAELYLIDSSWTTLTSNSKRTKKWYLPIVIADINIRFFFISQIMATECTPWVGGILDVIILKLPKPWCWETTVGGGASRLLFGSKAVLILVEAELIMAS